MASRECVLLDTRAFDTVLNSKRWIIAEYNSINEEYDRIIQTLKASWKGKGADAFMEDAATVKKNITSICDILKTMCDVLQDCKDVYAECDHALGNYNRDPQ